MRLMPFRGLEMYTHSQRERERKREFEPKNKETLASLLIHWPTKWTKWSECSYISVEYDPLRSNKIEFHCSTVNIWSEIILLKRPVLNFNHVSDFFLISFNFSWHLFSVFHFYCHFKFTRWLRAHGFWILNRILCQFLITIWYKTWESELQMSRFVALVLLWYQLLCHFYCGVTTKFMGKWFCHKTRTYDY